MSNTKAYRIRLVSQKGVLLIAIFSFLVEHTAAIASNIESNPESKRFVELGQMLEFNANLDTAKKAYAHAILANPASIEAHRGLARINTRTGATDEAVAELISVTKLNPEDQSAWQDLSSLLRKQGRAKEAIVYLKSACAKPHKDLSLERELAFTLLEAGEPILAAEKFQVLIRQQPELIDNYIGLAIADFRKGDIVQSESDIHKVLELNPEEPNALCLQGDLALSKNNLNAAIDAYKKAIAIRQSLSKPYLSLANLYIERGDTEKAREILEAAINQCPPEADIFIGLGMVAERNNEQQRAIDLFERARELEIDPYKKNEILRRLSEIKNSNINQRNSRFP